MNTQQPTTLNRTSLLEAARKCADRAAQWADSTMPAVQQSSERAARAAEIYVLIARELH